MVGFNNFVRGQGGQFAGSTGSGGSGGGTQVPAPLAKAFSAEGGTLSYDAKSNRGTGYGRRGGSQLVKLLQQALNRAGLTDGRGRPLAVDGKLGPLTTAAVKKAQTALGIKPADGKVTAELLTKILGMPQKPTSAHSRMRHKAPTKRRPTMTAKSAAKPATKQVGGSHLHAY